MILKDYKKFEKMKNIHNLPYCWICGKQIALDDEVSGTEGIDMTTFIHRDCLPKFNKEFHYRHVAKGGKFKVLAELPDDSGDLPVKDGYDQYYLVKFWELKEQV